METMHELVHRCAPESPAGRIVVTIVAAVVGLGVLVFGLILQGQNMAEALLYLLISVATFVIAGQLTRGIVQQANAAPTTGLPDEPEADNAPETAIETLRRRYAEGELDHDEFQQRLDRLLETEELEQTTSDRERVFE